MLNLREPFSSFEELSEGLLLALDMQRHCLILLQDHLAA